MSIKNITQLRNELLVRERGKVQVSCAQMGEILANLSDMSVDPEKAQAIMAVLLKNGKRRLRKMKNEK